MFEEFDDWYQEKTKVEILNLEYDPLAAILMFYKFGEPHFDIYNHIKNYDVVALYEDKLDEYVPKAEEIRQYYHSKLVTLKLKGKRLTDFQKKLGKFLNTNFNEFPENFLPLTFKLPEFYEEDLQWESLVENRKSFDTNKAYSEIDESVKFVKKIKRNTRYTKNIKYFFETVDKKLICLTFINGEFLAPIEYVIKQDNINVKGLVNYRDVSAVNEKFIYGIADKNNFEIY